MSQSRDFSEKMANDIDSEIKKIVTDNYLRSKGILDDNIDLLHKLAEVLLEKEVLDGEEIDEIIFGDKHPGGGILLRPHKCIPYRLCMDRPLKEERPLGRFYQ